MSQAYRVLAGIGVLIGIYLFVVNYEGSVGIIRTLGTQGVAGIKTLQGR